MKIIFFGTPEYAAGVAETLHKSFKIKKVNSPIAAVVTQKPKPVGRKKMLAYSAVDAWAHKKGVPIFFTPTDIIKNNIKADLGILASYGAIIPTEVISFFPHGILNIHPSLLPVWRGSSPVQASIIAGSGVGATIIKIDDKLDHGPIVSQSKDEVHKEDTTQTLRDRLFKRASEVLVNLIPAYLEGKIKLRDQDHTKASFTREIKKEDSFIPPMIFKAVLKGMTLTDTDWQIQFIKDFSIKYSPITIQRFIRAMQPWPQAWTKVKIKNQELRIKILESHLEPISKNQRQITNHKSLITNQKFVPDIVQLEGKKPVSWRQFKDAYSIEIFE